MTQPINLNHARKSRARDEKRAQSNENVAKFGRSKAERALEATRNVQARAMLDRHHMDEED